MENDIYRGDIFYIDYGQYTGSEQRAGRPGIIVSNDMNNVHSTTVEVVYLTTQPKEDLPTHVLVRSTNKVSTALCEQITTVSKERVGKYLASCTEVEMQAIDRAIMVSLQIDFPTEVKTPESVTPPPVENPTPAEFKEPAMEAVEVSRVVIERDIYKELYERLFTQLTGVKT